MVCLGLQLAPIVGLESPPAPEPDQAGGEDEDEDEDEEAAAAFLKFGASTSPNPSPKGGPPLVPSPEISLRGPGGAGAAAVSDEDMAAVSLAA